MPITTSMDAQGLHDLLLEHVPGQHDPACALCIVASVNKEALVDAEGGSTDVTETKEKTFSEEDVKAAIAAATAPLTSRIQELETAAGQTEVEQRVAEVKAEAQAELDKVQQEKDALAVQMQAEKDRADAAEKLINDAAEAEAKGKLADERLAKVAEVAKFPKEYLTANRDRIVAMNDDAFSGWLEDLRVVAAKSSEGEGGTTTEPPAGTHMTATAADAGASSGSTRPTSVLKDIIALRGGPDLRIPEGV